MAIAEEIPRTPEQIAELALYVQRRLGDVEIFCGYLIGECGLDRALCRDALLDVWPEAARCIAQWMPS